MTSSRTFAVSLLLALMCACSRGGDGNTDTPPSHTASVVSDDTISAVITHYYDAIGARDYQRAYMMWGDSGRSSRQTLAEFEQGFAQTKRVDLKLGERGRVEGAAGSRYVEVPASVRSTQADGSRKCFEGTYTLRRVVVDGATAAQRAWHIDSASMHEIACPPQ